MSGDLEPTGFTTNIPFPTKEPEIFQAEIIVSAYLGEAGTERRYFLARNGERSLITFDFGGATARSKLRTADGRVFILDHDRKISAEIPAGNTAPEENAELKDFLTTRWLNEKSPAVFKSLGTENKLAKYLVKPDDTEKSEILIYVDEKIKLPVRQEFYTLSGDRKILTSSVEIKNFKPSAEDKLFEVP